jgi:hypothetical protein
MITNVGDIVEILEDYRPPGKKLAFAALPRNESIAQTRKESVDSSKFNRNKYILNLSTATPLHVPNISAHGNPT